MVCQKSKDWRRADVDFFCAWAVHLLTVSGAGLALVAAAATAREALAWAGIGAVLQFSRRLR
jgi:hypothetical protein